jgi:hypothetical protein
LDEVESNEQADSFYNEKIHADKLSECNSRGYYFDSVDGKCLDQPGEEIFLSKWECSRNGLETVAPASANSDELNEIDAALAAGYQFLQCGSVENLSFVMLVKRVSSNDKAEIELRRFSFLNSASDKLLPKTEGPTNNGDNKTPTASNEDIANAFRKAWRGKDLMIGSPQLDASNYFGCVRFTTLPGPCTHGDWWKGGVLIEDTCDVLVADEGMYVAITCKNPTGECAQFNSSGPRTLFDQINSKTRLTGHETILVGSPGTDTEWKIAAAVCDAQAN